LKINLRIQFVTGETKDAIAGPADLVAFEDKFNLSIANLEAEMRVTHLLWLAWKSESRQKHTALEFDAWLETVESINPTDSKK
jgi:hypothetical protein